MSREEGGRREGTTVYLTGANSITPVKEEGEKKNKDKEKEKEQVSRGYIRCDYSIVTHCFIDDDVI